MAVFYMDATRPQAIPEGERETLTISISYTNWILEDSRLGMEQSLNRWFQLWLMSLLRSGESMAVELIGREDFNDIQTAMSAVSGLAEYVRPEFLFPDLRFEALPTLFLSEVHGSKFWKRNGMAIVLCIGGVFGGAYQKEIHDATKPAFVYTGRTLAAFVHHIRLLPEDIRNIDAKIDQRIAIEASIIYSKLAAVPDGVLEIKVSIPGKPDVDFKITSAEAKENLLILLRRAMTS